MEQVLPTVFQKRAKIQGDQLREAELTAPVLSWYLPALWMLLCPSPLWIESKIYFISQAELLKYDFVLGFMFKSSTPGFKARHYITKQLADEGEKTKEAVNITVPHTIVNKCIESVLFPVTWITILLFLPPFKIAFLIYSLSFSWAEYKITCQTWITQAFLLDNVHY